MSGIGEIDLLSTGPLRLTFLAKNAIIGFFSKLPKLCAPLVVTYCNRRSDPPRRHKGGTWFA